MVLFWFMLVLGLIGANASGEFTILHSPESLKFNGHSSTPESILKEVFSASLGLSVDENIDWEGLHIKNPFNTPEAAVEVHVDGISKLFENEKVTQFPLLVDEYEPDTFESVTHRIRQHFIDGRNNLVNIKLSDPKQLLEYSEIFGTIPKPKVGKTSLQYLKHSVEEDYQFLSELETLKAITAKINSGILVPDNMVDFYNFRFTSLHALSDLHGANSPATKEAKRLLVKELEELSRAFVAAYDGSVVVTAVTTDVQHTRRTIRAAPRENMKRKPLKFSHIGRQGVTTTIPTTFSTTRPPATNPTTPLTDPTNSPTPKPTPDPDYSEDYPAIFNIILWFGVVFTFTLVAIVYAIMDMDPGRDSIIYRMTSMRTKKDN